MNYTYRDLLDSLKELSDEQLDTHVVIYDPNNQECFPSDQVSLLSEHNDRDLIEDIFDYDPPMICITKAT